MSGDSKNQEKYGIIASFAPIGFFEIKFDGLRFEWVSNSMCRILGFAEEELLKLDPLELLDEKSKMLFLNRIKNVLDGNELEESVDYKVKTRSGKELWANFHIKFTYKDGKVDGALVVAQDVTERKKAEEALREREEQFRFVAEAAKVMVYEVNIVKNRFKVYRGLEELLGYKIKEISCTNDWWMSQIHPDDKVEIEKELTASINSATDAVFEYRIRRKQGDYIIVHDTAKMVKNQEGKVVRFVGGVRDVTKRKKEEMILREQSLVISSAPDAIFSTDNSFNIKSWNKAAENIFGWSSNDIKGQTSWSIFNPVFPTPNGTTREELMNQVLNTGYWRGEIIFHKKNGSPVPVLASSSVVKDQKGNITGIVAIVHDITSRKRRIKVLKDAQLDLNRAQAVARTGSWRLNTRYNILLWSDENYRIFGVPKGTPMTYESFLKIVHPEDRKFVDRRWKAALQGEPYDIEHRIIANGDVKWVRERAELEFDNDGKLQGGFGTTQEITDLVEMRDKLEDSRVQIEEYANRMEHLAEERAEKLKKAERLAAIGATAGMVGHDIRNPLQAITGDVYLALMDLDTVMNESTDKESLKESLLAIKKNVEYISKIVADLQDYSRPIRPTRKEVDLEELIEENIFKIETQPEIEASCRIEDSAKTLVTDPDLLKRIIENLCSNAVQAMQKGGKLDVYACTEGDNVVITVKDTGVGIPETVKDKLFTPLFTTKAKGQGFGLAVVKRITEALDGTIEFESKEGKGTKFIVKIPLGK